MTFRPTAAIRRIVLALAALQLAITVAVPLAEAKVERAPGPVSVETQHTNDCVTIHRPSACVLCQHLITKSHAARPAVLPPAPAAVGVAAPAAVAVVVIIATVVQPPATGPPPHLG